MSELTALDRFDDLAVLMQQAQSYAADNDHEKALAYFLRARGIAPDNLVLINSVGLSHLSKGDLVRARKMFQLALVLDPGLWQAKVNIATVLHKNSEYHLAGKMTERAIHIEPYRAMTYLQRADYFHSLNDYGSEKLFHKIAAALDPALSATYGNMGVSLQEIGEIDDARKALRRAISCAPKSISPYSSLAEITKLEDSDPLLGSMMSLAEDMSGLDDRDKISLHFALGKCLLDINNFEKSFSHFLDGNRLKRKSIKYNETRWLGMPERIRSVFSHEFIQQATADVTENPSRLPIFIVGMPRSGSTLLEQILASHPSISAAGEVHFFNRAVVEIAAENGLNNFPDFAPQLTSFHLKEIADRYEKYVTNYAKEINTKHKYVRIIDKYLGNFKNIGFIHLAFPNALIINIRRNKIDTCLSCFSKDFLEVPYSFELSELGRFYRSYELLMEHWHKVLPPGRILELNYEDITENFEHGVRGALAATGLDWSDDCLRFFETKRPVFTASLAQVRRPLFKSSTGRWKLDDERLRPLLEALNGNPVLPSGQ